MRWSGVAAALAALVTLGATSGPDTARIDADAATALARPLFSPSRRPAPATTPDAVRAPADAPPCLRGTIVDGRGALALFGATSAVTARGAGEAIEGWRVDVVEPGHARLSGPPGSVVAAVSFCGKPGTVFARVPPPPAPNSTNEMGDETPQLPASFKNPPPPLALPLRRR